MNIANSGRVNNGSPPSDYRVSQGEDQSEGIGNQEYETQ